MHELIAPTRETTGIKTKGISKSPLSPGRARVRELVDCLSLIPNLLPEGEGVF